MMKLGIKTAFLSLAGLIGAMATAAQAEPPGVYYSWRETEISLPQCIRRAEAALEGEGLENILAESTSIAGRTENLTAIFICLEQDDVTTVMVVVAGEDNLQAISMREALKATF